MTYPPYPTGSDAAPAGPYPYAAPMFQQMPKPVRTARVLIYVLGGIQFVSAGLMALLVAAVGDELSGPAGMYYAQAGVSFCFGVALVILASKFRTGTNPVRITAIVLAAIMVLSGLVMAVQGGVQGLLPMLLSVLVINSLRRQEAQGWFTRPRG